MSLEVSKIEIRDVASGSDKALQAFADVEFGGSLTVRSFPIFTSKQGVTFVKVPTTVGRNKGRRYPTIDMEEDFMKDVFDKILAKFAESSPFEQ